MKSSKYSVLLVNALSVVARGLQVEVLTPRSNARTAPRNDVFCGRVQLSPSVDKASKRLYPPWRQVEQVKKKHSRKLSNAWQREIVWRD
jgi:hypothetical protein